MRVVAENTDADIRRNQAMSDVEWRLRELTANLMRVTRGAGEAALIGRQAADLLEAMVRYRDAVGYGPSAFELQQALSLQEERDDRSRGEEEIRDWAERQMVRGALQIAASTLLGQRTQVAAGERQLFEGLRLIEDQRRANRTTIAPSHAAKVAAQRRELEALWKSGEPKSGTGRKPKKPAKP